jgi:hypothetical protein
VPPEQVVRVVRPFADVLSAIESTGTRFVVVGGVAAIMQGVERVTYDLDLVIELTPPGALAVVDKLLEIGYRARIPADPRGFADPETRAGWIRDKGMMVFSLWDTIEQRPTVDLFVSYPLDFELLWREATVVELENAAVRVAAPRHLAIMKRLAGRPKDREDIRALGLNPDGPDEP